MPLDVRAVSVIGIGIYHTSSVGRSIMSRCPTLEEFVAQQGQSLNIHNRVHINGAALSHSEKVTIAFEYLDAKAGNDSDNEEPNITALSVSNLLYCSCYRFAQMLTQYLLRWNPIELCWNILVQRLKTFSLYMARCLGRHSLVVASQTILNNITHTEVDGCYRKCGY